MVGAAKQWLAVRVAGLILVAGWSTFLVYAYPGLMTRDSFDQLDEARAGVYGDGHPPMMQLLWSLCDRVAAGPFVMLVVQSGLFVGGMYLVFRHALSRRAAAVAAATLLLAPPVGAVMAVVWKDCLMAGFLAMAFGLALHAHRLQLPRGRRAAIGALVFATLAAGARYNAAAATLPLVVLVVPVVVRHGGGRLRRYAIAGGIWLATTIAALGTDAALTDQRMYSWYSSLAVADIAGTLHYIDEDIPDAALFELLRGAPLTIDHDLHRHARQAYRPDTFLPLVEPSSDRMFDLPQDRPPSEGTRAAIASTYRTLVLGHPAAYLRHRLQVFAAALGLVGESWDHQTIITHDAQWQSLLARAHIAYEYTDVQRAIGAVYLWFAASPLGRPYVYFGLALVLVVLARKQTDAVALLGSGLLLEASLFVVGPSSDFRYSHWLVVTSVAALVIVIARRFNAADRSGT